MLVGQGLTLLYLDPATIEQGGVTTREALLSQLSASMGTEQLMAAFNAKKRRMDERVAQELVRAKVSEAVRRLASLGFVELLPEERIRLRASLMRFAEPVRGSGADLEALSRLVASGEVALTAGTEGESAIGEATDSDDEPGENGAESDPLAARSWSEGTEWGASFDAPAGEAEAELETEAEAELEAGVETEAEAGTEAEPETEAELQPEPETEVEPESDTEPRS
jgi:chromosome partition protein MukE